jgi:ABC-type branched-subunit amino acid transport system substrate-binding protein
MGNGVQIVRSGFRKVVAAVWAFVKKFIIPGLVGIVVSVALLGRVTDWWRGPSAYKIYIVGDFRPSFQATKEVRQGFAEGGDPRTRIDGVPLSIEQRDDSGDPARAAEVASELIGRDDTLLVVGHLVSTQTEAALPYYLRKAKPQVPVILVTETNPNLMPPGTTNERYPILRLSPLDNKQAEQAADFAQRKGARNFWVVEDTSNPTYSRYLALEFIKQVQSRGNRVLLWSNNMMVPSADTLKAFKIDCVFFAGEASKALILIRQIRAINWGHNPPMIILSDWCADPKLINEGGADVGQGVYLTNPLDARDYSTTGRGYVPAGELARTIVDQVLDDASRRFRSSQIDNSVVRYALQKALNIHRVSDARRTIIEVLREHHSFSSGEIQFDDDGNRIDAAAKFHIWTIGAGRFVPAAE